MGAEGASHRQWPVDAGHLHLQPAQVHEEEDEEGHQEPEHHHLEELEGVPAGPAAGQPDAQEGNEQRQLEAKHGPLAPEPERAEQNLRTSDTHRLDHKTDKPAKPHRDQNGSVLK